MRQGMKKQLDVPDTAKGSSNSLTRLLDGTASVPRYSGIAGSQRSDAAHGGSTASAGQLGAIHQQTACAPTRAVIPCRRTLL